MEKVAELGEVIFSSRFDFYKGRRNPGRQIHWHRFNSGQRIKRRRAVVWWL